MARLEKRRMFAVVLAIVGMVYSLVALAPDAGASPSMSTGVCCIPGAEMEIWCTASQMCCTHTSLGAEPCMTIIDRTGYCHPSVCPPEPGR